jgi:hypothetical protein
LVLANIADSNGYAVEAPAVNSDPVSALFSYRE